MFIYEGRISEQKSGKQFKTLVSNHPNIPRPYFYGKRLFEKAREEALLEFTKRLKPLAPTPVSRATP